MVGRTCPLIRFWLFCCTLALLLAGCSTVRFAYDHLDFLLRRSLSDYIDFTPQQRQLFEAEVKPVWRWHRSTQLPLYSAELRQLAGEAGSAAVDRERVERYLEQVDTYREAVSAQSLPGTARFLSSLSDVQTQEMILRMRKEVAKVEKKREKLARKDNEDFTHETESALHPWIGRLTPEQHRLVGEWSGQVQAGLQQQTAEQYAELTRFGELMASRGQNGFEERLDHYFDAPESGERYPRHAAERQRFVQLLADLSALLQPQQRERLRQKLLDYAKDCDVLAAEKAD